MKRSAQNCLSPEKLYLYQHEGKIWLNVDNGAKLVICYHFAKIPMIHALVPCCNSTLIYYKSFQIYRTDERAYAFLLKTFVEFTQFCVSKINRNSPQAFSLNCEGNSSLNTGTQVPSLFE